MPDHGSNGTGKAKTTQPRRQASNRKPAVPVTDRVFDSAAAAVQHLETKLGPVACYWRYDDGHGEPVGLVARWDRPDGKKEIRPISRNSTGWVVGAMPEPRPLYQLPTLSDAETLVITEGEKACEAAREIGFTTTTSAGGANAPKKSDWQPLAGKSIVVIPDNDSAGEGYAEAVVGILATLNPRPSVRVVRLVDHWRDLPKGGDIADVLDLGEDPQAIRAAIDALIEAAEPVEFSTVEPATPQNADESPMAFMKWRPFPVDLLPEPLGAYVDGVSGAIGCDPVLAAIPALVICASSVGLSRALRMDSTWSEYSILWGMTIADSGVKKSPPFRLAKRPLMRAEDRERQRIAELQDEYEADRARFDLEYGRWKKSPDSPRPKEPQPPTSRRYAVSDVTIEAISCILEENPRGVLVERDELAGWISSFGRYTGGCGGAGDAANWLSLFYAGSISVNRRTGDKREIYTPRAAVSICGTTQPGTLWRLLGSQHVENGLFARFLVANPPKRITRWADRQPPPQGVLDRYERIVGRLLSLEGIDRGEGLEPAELVMSPEAEAIWEVFHDEIAERQQNATGPLAASLSKIEAYGARLSLLFHCIRWADGEIADMAPLDADSMRRGCDLARWFANEAERILAIKAEPHEDRGLRELVDRIRAKGGVITVRELSRGSRLYQPAEVAERKLSDLVEAGIGFWEHPAPGPKGGQPTRRFRLTDSVDVAGTPADDPVSGGSVNCQRVNTPENETPEDDDSTDFGEV